MSAGPVVVRLGAADVDDLMALESLCFDYHWTREQFLLGLERGAYHVFGIRSRGALAAYAAVSIVAGEMEILNIAAHPQQRRKGLATALLRRVFAECRARGVEQGFLDVKASNRAAIDLYRRFGFKQYGVRERYYPDTGEDAVLMRCDDFSRS